MSEREGEREIVSEIDRETERNEYQRTTVTLSQIKRVIGRARATVREREMGGGYLSRVRTETESGRETDRDTQRRRWKDLLPFFAVTVPPCIRVCA